MKNSIILTEIFKVFSKKIFILFFVVLILVSSFFIYTSQIQEKTILDIPAKYKNALFDDLNKFSTNEEKLNFINEKLELIEKSYREEIEEIELYTTDTYTDRQLLKDVLFNLEIKSDYPAYVNYVIEQSETITSISIFADKESFVYKNAIKTQEDFEYMENVQTEFEISYGVNMATDFIFTDLIVIILLFIICEFIIGTERNINIIGLQKTCKNGRGKLIGSKIIALFVTVTFVCVSFYGVNILIAGFTYGFGDLSRTIQSVDGFENCIYQISVLQYFIISVILKIIVMFIISLFINLMYMLLKSKVGVYIVTILLGAVMALPVFIIEDNSNLMALKYINIVNFIDIHNLFSHYINVNLFTIPINYMFIFIVSNSVLFLGLIFANIMVYKFKRIEGYNKISSRTIIKFKGSVEGTNVFLHEMQKTFLGNKVIWILIIFLAFQIYAIQNNSITLNQEEIKSKFLININSGDFDKQKPLIENQIKEHEEIMQEISKAQVDVVNNVISQVEYDTIVNGYRQHMVDYADFERLFLPYYEYLKTQASQDKEVAVLVHDGYNTLFGLHLNLSIQNALFVFILIIICVVPIFTREYERNTIPLLKATKLGLNKLLLNKFSCAMVVAVIINLLVYIPFFIQISDVYRLDNLNKSICSIPQFANYSDDITIMQMLIIVFAVRMIVSLIITGLISLISVATKNTITSIVICTFIFVIPLVLPLIDITILNSYSLFYFQNFGQILVEF